MTHITDAQVNAALTAHYPGEWPDDPIFHKLIESGAYAGRPWRCQLMDEMRRTLEAAFEEGLRHKGREPNVSH